jgi:hypothetical protein
MTKEGSGDMASPADHALWAKIYKNRQNRTLEGHEEEVAAYKLNTVLTPCREM